jgi:hypothetical protein
MEVGADLIVASIPAPQSFDLGGVYMGRGRPVGDGVSFEYLSLTEGSTHFAPTVVMNGFIHRDIIEYHSQ